MSESFTLPPSAPPVDTIGLLGAWGPWLKAGKAYDWSGKEADGTPSANAALALSRFGQAWSFDGSSYINLGTPSHLAGKVVDFTVTARLICTTSAWNPIYAAYQTTTGGKLWSMFRIESTSNVLAYYTVASGGGFDNYATSAGDAIVLGNAYFVAVAVVGPTSAPQGRFYINGKYLPFSMNAIGTPDATVPIYIGGDVYGEGFNGKIADLRIYNRELSRPELDRLCADSWQFSRRYSSPIIISDLAAELTGSSSTATARTPVVSGDAAVSPSGTLSTGLVGIVSVAGESVTELTGTQATGLQGELAITGEATVTPDQAQAQAQARTILITSDATVLIVGVTGQGQVGTVTVSFGAGVEITLTGAAVLAQAGSVTVTGGATVTPQHAQATGHTGAFDFVTEQLFTLVRASAHAHAGQVIILDVQIGTLRRYIRVSAEDRVLLVTEEDRDIQIPRDDRDITIS